MENVTFGLALVAGFLSFISPCVLPLVPAYIGYMGGRLTHNVARQTSAGGASALRVTVRLQMLLHGIAFVLGFTLIFVLIGFLTTALASIAGQFVSTFTESIGRIGGLVIIFFGLQFMGLLPRFFRWLRAKSNAGLLDNVLLSIVFALVASAVIYWGFVEQIVIALPLVAALVVAMSVNGAFAQPAVFWNRILDRLDLMIYSDTRGDVAGSSREGLLGSAFMGMVFSAGWTPCIGPLLGTILTVAAATGATTGDIVQGMLLLSAYSIGLGIPFIVTALLMNSAGGILRRLQRHMRKIELFSGTLLILIGLLVASGQLQSLSQTFSQGDFADFTFRVEECGIGYFEGRVGLGHVGACLGGTLIPVALNQSAGGFFKDDVSRLEYLFHADEGTAIDVEVRGLGSEAPDFRVTLYSPADAAIATSDKAGSLMADGMFYPLTQVSLEQDGLYRLVLEKGERDATGRFRVKARESQPLTLPSEDGASAEEAGVSISLASLAENALNSLSDIASELGPAVGLAEGNRAPDFTIRTVDGQELSLSDLRGKLVLLNFWGTWCGPCRREMPEFQKAYEEFREEGLLILAIAYNDTEAAIRDFRDEFGLTFPLALDDSGEINDSYAVQTRPSTYIIGRDGLIWTKHFGIMTEPQLRELFDDMLPEH
ncbi:MAG: cytochrome c biogenesis protein/redoxin [Chloroflexota bacterium]|nr:cytochrome c biogenesis protein/redoxin [Chloroflexota bacterium]